MKAASRPRAIHARQRARRTLAAWRAKAANGRDRWRCIVTRSGLLRPLAVVNPYADRLTFLDDRTRTRRDHEKYLALIDTIALLHQHQRPVKTLPHRRAAARVYRGDTRGHRGGERAGP